MIVFERRKDAKASRTAKLRKTLKSRHHSPFVAMLLRLLCCETMVAALGLLILTWLSWKEITSIDVIVPLSSGWVMRLVRPFFSFALYGILTTTGSIIAVLFAASLNVSAYKNKDARNLVRVYLLVMFLMTLVDLILHAAMGEIIRRAYYPG